MRPLKITISLSTPMVEPEHRFHLDGLLGSLRVAREFKVRDSFDPREVHHDLPLETYRSPSGEWVFKASAFKLHRQGAHQQWMMSIRLNTTVAAEHRAEGFLNLRGAKPNKAGGPFKGSTFNATLVWGELEAVCVGEKSLIEELLAECTHVGSRRSTGFGRVAGIKVAEISEDECRWYDRALPADYDGPGKDELVPAIEPVRAPYWDRTLFGPALVPLVV